MTNLKLYNGNYSFGILDFDWNILNTDTPLYFKNIITNKIEKIPGSIVDQNPEIFYSKNSIYKVLPETYSESRDFFMQNSLHRGFDWLFEDTLKAIENNWFAPSFKAFKNIFLVKARVFAILTARWNSPDNFHKVFHFINNETLNEAEKEEQHENIIKNFKLPKNTPREEALYHYLWLTVNYVTCNNPQIEKIMWFDDLSSAERKAQSIDFLINYYIKLLEKIHKNKILDILWEKNFLSIGFSDDSQQNVTKVYKKSQEIIHTKNIFSDIPKKFSVYYTWEKEKTDSVLDTLWDKNLFSASKRDFYTKIKLKK